MATTTVYRTTPLPTTTSAPSRSLHAAQAWPRSLVGREERVIFHGIGFLEQWVHFKAISTFSNIDFGKAQYGFCRCLHAKYAATAKKPTTSTAGKPMAKPRMVASDSLIIGSVSISSTISTTITSVSFSVAMHDVESPPQMPHASGF